METQMLLRRVMLFMSLIAGSVGFSSQNLCEKPFAPLKRTLKSETLRLVHDSGEQFSIIKCQAENVQPSVEYIAELQVPGFFIDDSGRGFFPFTTNNIDLGDLSQGLCQTGSCQILFWEDDEGYPIRWGISIFTDDTGPLVEQYLYPNLAD